MLFHISLLLVTVCNFSFIIPMQVYCGRMTHEGTCSSLLCNVVYCLLYFGHKSSRKYYTPPQDKLKMNFSDILTAPLLKNIYHGFKKKFCSIYFTLKRKEKWTTHLYCH